MAKSMWTLGRRSVASFLPRSALPGFAPTSAGPPRPAKDLSLSGLQGLRIGTAAAPERSQSVSIRTGSCAGRTPGGRPRTPRTRRASAPAPAPAGPRLGGESAAARGRAAPSLPFSR